MGKTKRLVTKQCGRYVKKCLYDQAMSNDPPDRREAKKNYTSEARKRMNNEKSTELLELLLAGNFEGAMVLTLTYDDQHLPDNRDDAVHIFKLYIDRIRHYFRKTDRRLKYAGCVEGRHGIARFHHHLILYATAEDIPLLTKQWKYGSNIEIKFTRDFDDFGVIARYMTKEARYPFGTRTGDRSWTTSHGLIRPTKTSELVNSDTELSAPPSARIKERFEKHNTYGDFLYLNYVLPSA